jgi:site-specific recombinase XerD
MSTELVDPRASVRAYLEAEKSTNTRRAYATDWADFSTWCKNANEQDLPATPLAIASYLAQLADRGSKASTIQRRLAALRAAHLAAGFEPPTNAEGVKATMRGIRRKLGTRPNKKKPATSEIIAILRFPDTLAGIRDRAIVLLGFAAARRRSEIVDLKVNSIEWRPKGILLHIGRSKTDQEGRGELVPVPRGDALRPVDALEAWLKASGISEGPLFRNIDRHGNIGTDALSDRAVADIVKKVCGAAGLEASAFSGHSLRAGFVTSALDRHVDYFKIMGITGHVKVDTLREYDRRESDFEDPAGGGFL